MPPALLLCSGPSTPTWAAGPWGRPSSGPEGSPRDPVPLRSTAAWWMVARAWTTSARVSGSAPVAAPSTATAAVNASICWSTRATRRASPAVAAAGAAGDASPGAAGAAGAVGPDPGGPVGPAGSEGSVEAAGSVAVDASVSAAAPVVGVPVPVSGEPSPALAGSACPGVPVVGVAVGADGVTGD
ncbi:hypothetical protein [Klenkia terrae]|uniref:Uncharacterized protein n=1 Tax=Klenkia terrae TaxID=1052259 RepID=A0ABU8EDF0_9ACTN